MNHSFYHKTIDGKFNTIHNINLFYKKGKLIELSKNIKIIKILMKFRKKYKT